MRNIAIIPARGNSKRLPKKNILLLDQKPLLKWVVETCLESKIFDKVIVSTEDEEVQKVATQAGALFYKRNLALALDTSTVVEVCEDVLKNEECDVFCCIYATAALLSVKTLKLSFEQFIASKSTNILLGVSKYNYAPVEAISVDEKDIGSLLLPQYEKIKSQFHPKTRVSNGTFCWARVENFLKEKTFYGTNFKVYDVPEEEVCDIDTVDDYASLKKQFKK